MEQKDNNNNNNADASQGRDPNAFTPGIEDYDVYHYIDNESNEPPVPYRPEEGHESDGEVTTTRRKRKRDDEDEHHAHSHRQVEFRLLNVMVQTLSAPAPGATTLDERLMFLKERGLSAEVQNSLLNHPGLRPHLDAVIRASRKPQNNSQQNQDQDRQYSLDLPACLAIPKSLLEVAKAIGAVDPGRAIEFLLPMLKGILSTKNLDVSLELLQQTTAAIGAWLDGPAKPSMTERQFLSNIFAKAKEKQQQLEALEKENAIEIAFFDSMDKLNQKIHAPKKEPATQKPDKSELEMIEFLNKYYSAIRFSTPAPRDRNFDHELIQNAAAKMCHDNDPAVVMAFIESFERYIEDLAFSQGVDSAIIKSYLNLRQAIIEIADPNKSKNHWREETPILVQTSISQNENHLGALVTQWFNLLKDDPKEVGKMQSQPPSARLMEEIVFGLKHLSDDPKGDNVWNSVMAPIEKNGGIECMGKSKLLFNLRLQYLSQKLRWSSQFAAPMDTPSDQEGPEEIASMAYLQIAQLLSDTSLVYQEKDIAAVIDLLDYMVRDIRATERSCKENPNKVNLKVLARRKEVELKRALTNLGYSAKLFTDAPAPSQDASAPSQFSGFANLITSFDALTAYLQSSPENTDCENDDKIHNSDTEHYGSIIENYLEENTELGLDEHTAPIIAERQNIFKEVFLAVKYHLAPLALHLCRQHLLQADAKQLAKLLIHEVLLNPIEASKDFKTPYKLTLADAHKLWPKLVEFIPNMDIFCKEVEVMLEEMLLSACRAKLPVDSDPETLQLTPQDLDLSASQTRFILLVLIINQHLIEKKQHPIRIPAYLQLHRKIGVIIELLHKGQRQPSLDFLDATNCLDILNSSQWNVTWRDLRDYWRDKQWHLVADELLPTIERIAKRHWDGFRKLIREIALRKREEQIA